ncbi:efflux RND transporter permease subunit, partial [Thiohalobacter sp.]|uniref:efflux RND transporter permease subunit n=1 Tax=Thiohalobacter sp. TaxID=2025948 RepID=UPI00262A398B
MSPPGGSGAPTGMSTRFAEAVLRWRWAVILLVIGLTVAAGMGVTRLQPQNDARIWFGPDNPQRLALEALERTYNKIDNVYIAVAPESGDVFTRRILTALVELTEAAWQLPDANRVDSITNFQHTEANGDELVVGDLVEDPAALDERALQRVRRIALAEPQLVNRLLAPDGRAAGINVNIIRSGSDPDESTRITAAAEALVADFRARYPELRFYITGGVPFDAGFGRATKDDLRTFVPAMFLVIALTMALLLRSLTGMLVTMLVIACSTLTAMGIAGWTGMGLNPASGIAPTIILTLAVADSIHILVTAFQQMAQGLSRRAALVRSLELNMQPVA